MVISAIGIEAQVDRIVQQVLEKVISAMESDAMLQRISDKVISVLSREFQSVADRILRSLLRQPSCLDLTTYLSQPHLAF